MEQCKKDKFGVTELEECSFYTAREKLVEIGEIHLIHFLNSCICGELKDANKFKKLYGNVKENIDFIDSRIEDIKYPGNNKVKM